MILHQVNRGRLASPDKCGDYVSDSELVGILPKLDHCSHKVAPINSAITESSGIETQDFPTSGI
jgi:hypothetical protein